VPDSTTTTPARWPYQADEGHFDEMLDRDGTPRPHWQTLLDGLATLGSEEFDRRWHLGQQLIAENGVTYTIYGEDSRVDRLWQLDPVPLVISQSEWHTISTAAVQRARLVNAILADLYGPQRLLHDRQLPAAPIFAQSALVRPMIGVHVPHNIYCHLHAIDLARAPTGQWWVIGDRTQAPSGMGYALENRSVMTRTLPDLFADCRVTRLAEFFGHLNQTMLSLAPQQRDNPRVVLLTPGPYNETYFEHAYLARYLGYTLAEGRDLTVRDARVYLKTLSGLLPVDVILRRTDDLFCDPLELREDSVLGIPGLMQAVRAGTVAIANPLGSGLAQAPALLPFFPGLCRSMLGEELKLPTIATWWCGQPGPMNEVLDRLDQLVIKPSLPGMGIEPMFGQLLSASAREQLAERIRKSPRDWVAQEQVDLSTAPSWNDGKLQPRHTMLRVFVCARPDGSFVVMPGGLCRISPSPASMVVSMQSGGGSKDAWVLSAGAVNLSNPLPPPGAPVEITRAGQVLPSRVADEMYWLGRYAVRVEYGVRLARTIARRVTSEPTRAQSLLLLLSGRADDKRSFEQRFIDSIFTTNTSSASWRNVRADVNHMLRIAGNLRDRLPGDAWRAIAALDELVVKPRTSRALLLNQTADVLDRAMSLLSSFTGQVADSMLRDKGWSFLDTGRRIERSLHWVELIGWAFKGPTCSRDQLDELLEITGSTRTYRSRYLTTLQNAPVLDLVMLDETNPQSLAHQLMTALQHVETFPLEPMKQLLSDDRRILLDLLSRVRLLDVQAIFDGDRIDPQSLLSDLLARLNVELPRLSDVLTRLYLSHVRVSHQSRSSAGETRSADTSSGGGEAP
jgi:uncharacterized circularly permuted ATP-grasp superfamily protein/uncharacterized alpha-E superfamily protein